MQDVQCVPPLGDRYRACLEQLAYDAQELLCRVYFGDYIRQYLPLRHQATLRVAVTQKRARHL